MYKTNGYPIDR